jgi:hypothetical protein
MTDLETEITFKALSSLGYGGSFGETLDSFRLNNGDALTSVQRQELDEEVIRLQAIYDSQEYARLRKAAYDLLNQFEMQFDDQLNGTTTWVEAINEIKARHPK